MKKDIWWYNEESEQILNNGYLLKGETLEGAIDRITTAACTRLGRDDLKEPFTNLITRGWMSLSSPIWANMGTERGLPISCFNVHIPDSIEGITHKLGEVIMQTKIGGGTSGYFGNLRPRGAAVTNNGESTGAVSFMRLFDTAMEVISQGSTRRGSFAAYLDIDHPDVNEFLQIKDVGNDIQNLFYGVTIPDYWMQEMIDGNVEKRQLWAKILESRQQKGIPYLFFSDNVNNNRPQIYKDRNMIINASNLCSEIALPSTLNESFVCCLSSMNLELYDEWKDTDAVELAIYFLDAVMSEFIVKTENSHYLASANRFAKRHRALGLGVLGWHSYLQKNNIAFSSWEAKKINNVIFKQISEQSFEASVKLGNEIGFAPIFNEGSTKDIPRRNTTTMAIAPTTSSSAILGQVSAGIEPYSSNYYKVGLAKGNFMRKNKYLVDLLESYGLNTEDMWRTIRNNGGSVQHLEELTEHEKEVFKTFKEINQSEIVNLAVGRQKYIDQAQSLNINIPSEIPLKEVNQLIINGWQSGIKTFYYQRSQSVSKELVANLVNCASCES